MMRVAVVCEYSGAVRDAFTRRGHRAVSIDILPSETPGTHYQVDAKDFDFSGYDLAIAFPPCTHLAVSGARWFSEKRDEQREALRFFRWCLDIPCDRVAVENPVSIASTRIRPPDQTIQPWMFGHGETKATCLWLKNLPPLTPTRYVDGRDNRIHRMSPGPDRAKERARTYPGIAAAMAQQWTRPTPIQTVFALCDGCVDGEEE